MSSTPNAFRWDGGPGHYEVYYLTLTDRRTGVGVWIRYTMLAPLAGADGGATASLWFLAMDPRTGKRPTVGRKKTVAVESLRSESTPFKLQIGDALLSDTGMNGAFGDVSWSLSWTPCE